MIRPGYLDSHWTKAPWTTRGARGKAGATHLPLPSLPHAFLNAGLAPERLAEGGKPIPVMLAILAPQAPVSSAQINRHCIPAASRARKQHQRQADTAREPIGRPVRFGHDVAVSAQPLQASCGSIPAASVVTIDITASS